MFNQTSVLKYYLPAILWSLLILFLSTKGGIQLPPSIWDYIAVDKVGHLVFYGIFCILILGASTKNRTLPLVKTGMITALAVSIIYGIGMEVIQYTFFPNRYFEVPDIIANIIGSFLGLYFFKRFINKNF